LLKPLPGPEGVLGKKKIIKKTTTKNGEKEAKPPSSGLHYEQTTLGAGT